MVKILFLGTIIVSLIGCSRPQGVTVSKIKIFGGNAFDGSGALSSAANNGMIFYGRNLDGKSFLKKIDTGVIDLAFPNGVWSFYAVAWSDGAATSSFLGRTQCGKAENIKLSGTDVVIDLKISNANCADGAFTTLPTNVSGDQRLPSRNFISCRHFSGITGVSDDTKCARETFNNRGYATFMKLVVPQYKDFGNGIENVGGEIQSACIKLNTNLDISSPDSSQPAGMIDPSLLHLPESYVNGFRLNMKLYYSSTDAGGCDEISSFPDMLMVPKFDTPRTKSFSIQGSVGQDSVVKTFFQSDENQICQNDRLTRANDFAGGFGTYFSPYVICNPHQFKHVSTLFASSVNNSFEIARDLDFTGINLLPLGDASALGISSTLGDLSLDNLLEGNGHRLENIKLKCQNGETQNFGLIRNSSKIKFKNLVINRSVVDCESAINVGTLVGHADDGSFQNIKIFGVVKGNGVVGGVAGNATSFQFIKDSHLNMNINGLTADAVGGFFGSITGIIINGGRSEIVNSSFKGKVYTDSEGGGYGVGGVAGQQAGYLKLEKVKADLFPLQGYYKTGGFIGYASDLIISNSYVKGVIKSKKVTDGSVTFLKMGDFVGYVGAGFFSNSFSLAMKVAPNKGITDSTMNGVLGVSSSNNCQNVFYLQSLGSGGSCNSTSNLKTLAQLKSTATFSNLPSVAWDKADLDSTGTGGFPRLQFESTLASEIPYFKNECRGKYASLYGDGSESSPYFICTQAQLQTFGPDKKAVLKSDLYLSSYSPKAAGKYFLDGDDHTIYNLELTGNHLGEDVGLFRYLDIGSSITNLRLGGFNMSLPGNNIVGPINFGAVAGINKGVIKNIQMEGSTIKNLRSNIEISQNVNLGGLVGLNQGVMENVASDVDIFLHSTTSNNVSVGKFFKFGGVVGANDGDLKVAKIKGRMKINPYLMVTTGNESYGGVFGYNSSTGLVKEVEVLTDLVLESTGATSGDYKIGGVGGENEGNVTDVVAKNGITATNITSLNYPISIAVNSENVTRLVFSPTLISGTGWVSNSTYLVPTVMVTESFVLQAYQVV